MLILQGVAIFYNHQKEGDYLDLKKLNEIINITLMFMVELHKTHSPLACAKK